MTRYEVRFDNRVFHVGIRIETAIHAFDEFKKLCKSRCELWFIKDHIEALLFFNEKNDKADIILPLPHVFMEERYSL